MCLSPAAGAGGGSSSCFLLILLVIFFLFPAFSYGCLLCPLHIPARPKPLDQFRLPSLQKLVQTAESFESLCLNNSRLSHVSAECRSEVSHLFCSLTQLAQSLKAECPGPEEEESCARCRTENDRLYTANKWILTWVDSVGKMPSGISDGNYHWLGDYEQCQRLKDDKLFNGRYCLLEFHVPDAVLINADQCPDNHLDPLEIVLGICLPANCSGEETQGLVEYIADHRPILVNCEPVSKWPLAGLILLAICLIWIGIVLSVSALHWLHPSLRLPSPLQAFCLQANLRRSLSTTKPSGGNGRFQAAQGIQVLVLSLFVLGQSQVLVLPYLENIGHHYAFLEHFFAQPMLNPSLLIDSFLAIFAFQLALSSLPSSPLLPTIGRLFLIHWPQFAVATLGMAFVFARLGEGPMWSRTDIARRCATNWPENLLMVQNLLGHSHTCLDAGHFFSLQAQFLLLSLVILCLLSPSSSSSSSPSSPLLLPILLFLFLLFSSLFCCSISLLFPLLPPTLLPHRPLEPSQFGPLLDLLILNPLARVGAPLVGLLFGRLICPRLLDGQWQSFLRAFAPIGTILTFLGLGTLLWAPSSILPFVPSPFGLLYATFHRPLWAALLLCLLLLIEANPKGLLGKFLCWRVFRPLAKLVLPVLLLSEPVALSLFASLHRPLHLTPLSALLGFVGILVCSFLLAFAIDAALNRPIRQICWPREGQSAKPKDGQEQQAEENDQPNGNNTNNNNKCPLLLMKGKNDE